MKMLEDRILKEGEVLPGGVLKVGSFLNHQIDSRLAVEIAREMAAAFDGAEITKVLTVEASGIAFAILTASFLNVPMVFAKKHKTSNVTGEQYTVTAHSFTHNNENYLSIPKAYLNAEDKVLMVDDFLATGNAFAALADLTRQAGAEVVGAACAVEKAEQGGEEVLKAMGIRVVSMAVVESMDVNMITFRHSV